MKILTMVLVLGLSSTVSHADTKILKARETIVKPSPKFLEPLRDSNGNLMGVSLSDAYDYCESRNAHVPTPRELAILAMSHGAKGIIKSSRSPGWDPQMQYIETSNDHFYYGSEGYEAAIDEQTVSPNAGWWTYTGLGIWGYKVMHVLRGEFFLPKYRSVHYVRCVSNQPGQKAPSTKRKAELVCKVGSNPSVTIPLKCDMDPNNGIGSFPGNETCSGNIVPGLQVFKVSYRGSSEGSQIMIYDMYSGRKAPSPIQFGRERVSCRYPKSN